jgi:glycosyltransferase involved in cell wall biosynthesis
LNLLCAKRNVAIFSQSLQPGGSERQALYLAKALEYEHQVFFITFYKSTRQSEKNLSILNSLNVKHIELKGSWLKKIVTFYKLLKKEKIEIIFSYLLLPNFVGGLIGRLAGVKYSIGGIRSSKITKGKIWLNKMLQNHINKFTIYNNWTGYHRYSGKGFDASRALLIYNCIEFDKIYLKRENHDITKIISVGRFSEIKDYYTALLAVKSLIQAGNNIKYYIIGYGPSLSQIRSWIIEFELGNHVDVIINPPNIDEFYKQSDIFLLTSIFEGLSNSALEAMSFSLPLVLTNVGDNKKLLENDNGYLCKKKDHRAIAQKLEILVKNPNLRYSFGLKSFELVCKNHSLASFKEKYINLINSLK